MSRGYSGTQIASNLARNIKTIRAHKFNVMSKLGVSSDAGLLEAADILLCMHDIAKQVMCCIPINPHYAGFYFPGSAFISAYNRHIAAHPVSDSTSSSKCGAPAGHRAVPRYARVDYLHRS